MILFSIFEFFALSSTLAMKGLGIAIERGSLPSCSITEAKISMKSECSTPKIQQSETKSF
jgi:hypothetical protein